MKIENYSNFEIIPKQTLKRNDQQNSLTVSVSALFNDSVSISKTVTQKTPPKENVSEKLTGFGNKYFNQPVFDHYLAYRNDLKYKPVIEKLDQAISQGIAIKDLEKLSFDLTKEMNPNLKPTEVLGMSYRSINASTMQKKYSDPNFFNGEKDKIFHYFVSGSLTVDAFNNIPLLPTAAKAAIAGNMVLTIGWLKEVGSIPGNGYGADDMQANRKGIEAATIYLKNYSK